MNWLSLNQVEGILARCPYVYFMINSDCEGFVKKICRNAGFALLALFMIAFPASVTLLFGMLMVKYKGNINEETKT